MTDKKKEKQKDSEEPKVIKDSLAEFYGFLETLLPSSSKLLQETLDKHREALEQKAPKEQPQAETLLEFEKQMSACLRNLLEMAVYQYQRVSADYINFQKRVPKQIGDTIAYEKEMIIKSLLPTLDNFERTLQNAHASENAEAIIKGVQIIYDQMLDILKLQGVEQIKALGEKFDPALHEAVHQKTESKKQDGIILEESQKGYKLHGRVIRPSRVIVNKLPTEVPSEQKEQAEQKQEEKADIPKQIINEDEVTDTQ